MLSLQGQHPQRCGSENFENGAELLNLAIAASFNGSFGWLVFRHRGEMGDRYGWLSEGLAVYVEPVARMQAGDLTAKEIWQAMMRICPISERQLRV
jgi:hypothetical protein